MQLGIVEGVVSRGPECGLAIALVIERDSLITLSIQQFYPDSPTSLWPHWPNFVGHVLHQWRSFPLHLSPQPRHHPPRSILQASKAPFLLFLRTWRWHASTSSLPMFHMQIWGWASYEEKVREQRRRNAQVQVGLTEDWWERETRYYQDEHTLRAAFAQVFFQSVRLRFPCHTSGSSFPSPSPPSLQSSVARAMSEVIFLHSNIIVHTQSAFHSKNREPRMQAARHGWNAFRHASIASYNLPARMRPCKV